MIWAMRTQLTPGRLVDVGEDPWDQIIVECPISPDHLYSKRDWSVVNYIEPAAPQRRMLRGLDLYFCINSPAFLVSTALRDAMREAGLTGWFDIPAPVKMRDGTVLDGYHELRVSACFGPPGPDSGLRLLSICPGCGSRWYARGFRYDLALGDILPPDPPDFLSIWPMIGLTLCSDRARALFGQFDNDDVEFIDAFSMTKVLRPGDSEPPPFIDDATRDRINAFRNAPQPD